MYIFADVLLIEGMKTKTNYVILLRNIFEIKRSVINWEEKQ